MAGAPATARPSAGASMTGSDPEDVRVANSTRRFDPQSYVLGNGTPLHEQSTAGTAATK
jgi:hypothetical protein